MIENNVEKIVSGKNKSEVPDREILKLSYDAIRSEILTRITLRAQAVGFYVVASGALFGYFIKNTPSIDFILVFSFLSFSVSLIIAHQDFSIAVATSFCSKNLVPNLGGDYLWCTSTPSRRARGVRLFLRSLSQLAIFGFPPVGAISYAAQLQLAENIILSETTYGLLSIALAVATFVVLIVSTLICNFIYRGNS